MPALSFEARFRRIPQDAQELPFKAGGENPPLLPHD